jgi:hypothetical protein
MKKNLVLLIFCFGFLYKMNAQNVCIGINGSAPVALAPASKTVKICKFNYSNNPQSLSTVSLLVNVCGSSFAANCHWENITTGIVYPTYATSATVLASDTGKWVATIKNTSTLAVYTDTVHVIYYPFIKVDLDDAGNGTPQTSHCPLQILTLNATPIGLPPSPTYTWVALSPSPGDTIPGVTGPSLTFNRKGTQYMVFVKDVNGCAASDTSHLYGLLTYYKADLGPDITTGFCEGDATTLTTSVPTGATFTGYQTFYGYVNSMGVNTNLGTFATVTTDTVVPPYQDKFAPIPITLAPGTNKYWVRLSDSGFNCDGTDTISITAHPFPIVTLGPDTLACYGIPKTISANVTTGTAPYHYSWSPGSFSNVSTISVSPTINTTYSVTVTDVFGCGSGGTDSKLLTVNPKIDVTVSPDTTICRHLPGTANLWATASGGTGALTYLWTPHAPKDGLTNWTTLTPTAVPTSYVFDLPSSVFTFTATDANGCFNPSGPGQPNKVTVFYNKPVIASFSEPVVISETTPMDLNASAAGNTGFVFSWKTDTSSFVISTSPILSLSYNGPDTVNYIVTLHSPSGALMGCTNSDTIEVRYISDNTLLYVPNVFSPNAMNEENQKLRIYGDNLFSDGFKFLIYNKWGNLMYESTDLNEVKTNGWDGGAKVEGVYTYVIVGKFKNGKDVKESPYNRGTFTLVK